MAKRIFVVEDDRDIAELLAFNLRQQGFIVSTFSDGSEAYQEILKDLPDLVLLDLGLPGLTGMEICKYIRNDQRTQKVPIIILTAKTADSDRREGLKTGADRFMTKPFSIRDVLKNVQELLSCK